MKRIILASASLLLASLPLAPAVAGWKLVNAGAPVAVAKSALKVTPGDAWNRLSSRPIKKGEVWSIDGASLNELYFVSGLIPGEPLYREVDKKNNPLPKMRSAMQLTDVPEFFESSQRVALQTSVFEITKVEPATFGGQSGVKFTFQYAVNGSTLVRKGIAAGTVVANKLYLISFVAPSIYYFDRDKAKVEAIFASATL